MFFGAPVALPVELRRLDLRFFMRAMLQEGAIEVYAPRRVCGVLKTRRTPEALFSTPPSYLFSRAASFGFASEFRDS
jgi:hypothetical protein